jgi:hypothetical protein
MIKSERYLSLKEGFMPLTEDIYILSPETHTQTSNDAAHESEYHGMPLGQNEGISKAFNLDTHEDIQKSSIDKIDTLTLGALSFASIDAQEESTLIDESSKEEKESTLKLVKTDRNISETKYCCECQGNNKTNRWFMFLFFLV